MLPAMLRPSPTELTLLTSLVVLATACVGTPTAAPSVSNALACADIDVGAGFFLPPEFPPDIHLPAGTVLTEIEPMEKNRVLLVGVVPAAPGEAHAALVRDLVASGYNVRPSGAADAERSAVFTKGGLVGSWTLSRVTTCVSATRLTFVLGPTT